MHDPHDNHHEPSAESLARGHEQTDLSARAIASFLAILTVILGFVGIGMAGLYVILSNQVEEREPPASPLAVEQVLPPDPRLQALPAVDLAEMRAQDAAVLNTYGWVSREAQVVRIPIDRAMSLVASRGLPVFPITPPAQFQAGSSTGTPAAIQPAEPQGQAPAPMPETAPQPAPTAPPPAAIEPAAPVEPAPVVPAPVEPAPADLSAPAPTGAETPAAPEGASQP